MLCLLQDTKLKMAMITSRIFTMPSTGLNSQAELCTMSRGLAKDSHTSVPVNQWFGDCGHLKSGSRPCANCRVPITDSLILDIVGRCKARSVYHAALAPACRTEIFDLLVWLEPGLFSSLRVFLAEEHRFHRPIARHHLYSCIHASRLAPQVYSTAVFANLLIRHSGSEYLSVRWLR